MAEPLEAFTAAQRQRIEALRRATDRERSLLVQEDPIRHASNSSVRHAAPYAVASKRVDNTMWAAAPLSSATNPAAEMSSMRVRAAALNELAAKLAKDESAILDEEKRVDARISSGEEAKRDLLSTLIALQYRERELKARSATIDEDEAASRARMDESRQRLREISHQKQLLENDQAERQAKLNLSRKKLGDRETEQSKAIQRLKQQLNDQEDRVRGLELQLTSRVRAADDLERDVHRQMQLQRDQELAAIEELRADIQRSRAASGWA